MELKLWKNFSKRVNSTKHPGGTPTTMEVYLKQGTSVENPTFLIDGIDMDYNYCYWNGHYYYINDIVVGNNNIYELNCIQDLPATYTAEILASHQYVKYASRQNDGATNHFDVFNPDPRFQKLIYNGTSKKVMTPPIYSELTDGYFVLQTAGVSATQSQVAMVNSYLLDKTQLYRFANYLYNQETSILDTFVKEFGDVTGCVKSLRWVPISASDIALIPAGDRVESAGIRCGNQLTNVSANFYVSPTAIIKQTFNHTIQWQVNDWRRVNTTLSVYLPCVGLVSLSASDLYIMLTLQINVVISPMVGKIDYFIRGIDGAGTSFEISHYTGEYGYELPISMTSTNYTAAIGQLTTGAITAGLGLAAGNPLGVTAGFMQLAGGVSTMHQHSNSSIGSIGNPGFVRSRGNIEVYYQYNPTVSEPSEFYELMGRPVDKNMQVGIFRGYVQTVGASIDLPGLASDRNAINSMLDGGIYIE